MMSANEIVKLGDRLRTMALPLYKGDMNAAALFAHEVLMRAQVQRLAAPDVFAPPCAREEWSAEAP